MACVCVSRVPKFRSGAEISVAKNREKAGRRGRRVSTGHAGTESEADDNLLNFILRLLFARGTRETHGVRPTDTEVQIREEKRLKRRACHEATRFVSRCRCCCCAGVWIRTLMPHHQTSICMHARSLIVSMPVRV